MGNSPTIIVLIDCGLFFVDDDLFSTSIKTPGKP